MEMEISLYHRKWWLFGPKVYTTYSGSGTVWRDIKTGKRPATTTEMQLASLAWKRNRDESSALS